MELTKSLVYSISAIITAAILSFGIQNFNRNERTISVRGLAEKQVQANLAVWKIKFNVSSDKIEDVRQSLPKVQEQISKFLTDRGFQPNEIAKGSAIRDRNASEYGAEKGNRFVATGYYLVTTSKVDDVDRAEQQVDELVKQGVVITENQKSYHFTELNAIKPEMLDEATQNAKEAAQGFAKSMNVKVGKLKSATQGVFSIENPLGGNDQYSQFGEGLSSVAKKVRVVTQVEFYID